MSTNQKILFKTWKSFFVIFLLSFIGVNYIACKDDTDSAKGAIAVSDNIKTESSQISKEFLALEEAYKEMLLPINELKSSQPKIYWFIVSWLNTNYRTPNWKGYNSSNWQEKTKERGIDCSGFARVMQDKIFNRKIRGGSQGILKHYCKVKPESELKLGDLVFFKSRESRNEKITHVGTYLIDGYFVHVTSQKSAAKGFGLRISSLKEKKRAEVFVTGGEVKEKK